MEHVDLLYSGLMVTAVMLSLWTAIFVTAACVCFAPSILNRVPAASEPRDSNE